MTIKDFLKKERESEERKKKERVDSIGFASIFVLTISLATTGSCWSYGLSWVIAAFFAAAVILVSAILIGDKLTHGESLIKREITGWQNLIRRSLRSDFVQTFYGPWGIVTLIVMVAVGIAAYKNLTFWYGLLAGFMVGLLSVVVCILLPHALAFLFGQVMKGPDGEDDEDES